MGQTRKCRHRQGRTFAGSYGHPKGSRYGVVETWRCDSCLKTIRKTRRNAVIKEA